MRLFLIYILLIALSGFAQPTPDSHYAARQYSTYNGLVQSQINRIYQDSKGYLWICTKGGLSRFDGSDFHNFVDTKDGERINIQDIFENGNGFICHSVNKFFNFTYEEENPEIWEFEDIKIHPDYLFLSQVKFFYNPSDTSLYIFNVKKYGYKVGYFDHLKYNLINKSVTPLPVEHQMLLFEFDTKKGRNYLSSNGIYTFLNGKFDYKPLPGIFSNYALNPGDSSIYALQKASGSIIRLAKDFKSYTVEHENLLFIPEATGEPNSFIINRSGQLIFWDKKWRPILLNKTKQNVLGSFNLVRCLFLGRENNLWIGTEEGLFNLYSTDIVHYKFNMSPTIDNVWSLACAPDSTMWFSGFSTGVWSLSKEGKVHIYNHKDFKIPDTLKTNFKFNYMGGIRDKEGRIYLPSATGMLIIDHNRLNYRDTENIPMAIYDDTVKNRLNLAKIGGVEIIEKGSLKTILNVKSKNNFISACITKEGKPIFGTFKKQFILEDDSLKSYIPAKNLGTISMARDSAGNIWMGTPVGLYLYDGKTESVILPEKINGGVTAVYIKKQWLLAATVKEMFVINLRQFYRSGDPFAYKFGQENGFYSMDGGQNGFCPDNEGNIWYTVTDKVLKFNPDSLVGHYNNYIPKPHFASISFSKNAIDWLRFTPEDTLHLVQKHIFNSIRFTMIAVSETRGEKVVYQYRIKGMSDEWSKPTKNSQQTLTNLSPGQYLLEIRSSVDGENWSEVVNSPLIKIKSAWWQSWWAYSGEFLLVGILIVYLTVLFLKSRQKKIITRLSEQKRLNELRLQSVRSKNIPHFSGNALANIENFIFNSDYRQANKFLTKYSRLMNITLRDADKASRSLEQELEYVRLYLELEKMRFGIRLEYSIEVDPSINLMKELPNMLLQTWVENAIKHGIRHKEGTGKILVSVNNLEAEGISITVEDNGIGRKKARELGTSGTGQGLKILAEQLVIYNQINKEKIVVKVHDLLGEDGVATGTRYEMFIPQIYSYDF